MIPRTRTLLSLCALSLATVALAQSVVTPKPRSNMVNLGAVQPTAPGYRIVQPLPQIKLEPQIAGVRRIVYASNGVIEVAHAIVLVPKAESTLARTLGLAQMVATRTLATRSSLTVVDISLYQAEGYAGFGGPLPLFTAAVPRDRALAFSRVQPTTVDDYDHLWVNEAATPAPPELEPTGATKPGVPEKPLVFVGRAADLKAQKAERAREQQEGGARGGVFFQGDPKKPLVALTFDDAPHPMYIPLVLDALRRTGAKATFFVIGRNAVAYPYFVRDLGKAGHEIANHTYHHVRLPALSEARVRDELGRTNALLEKITGERVRYFRPPGGQYSKATLRIASSLGLTTAFWTDDPADFNNPQPLALEQRFLKRLRPGGIVLLHDNAQSTIPVLTDFVNDARGQGIEFVTLETLAGTGKQ